MTNGPPSKPTPKINNEYWFTFSQTLADNALSARDNAASRLQTLVTWLWGIYTAGAAVGFTLSGKALSFWPKFWIGAASGSLIAVYWCTVWVQVPKLVRFAPNEAESIKKAYVLSVRSKTWRLRVTLLLSVVAAVLVATSLMVASMAKEEKPQPPSLNAAIHTASGKRFLALTAMVPPKTETVTVTIEPGKTDTGMAPPMTKGVLPLKPKIESGVTRTKSHTAVYVPTPEGLVQKSILLEGLTPPLEVTLAWTDTAKKLRTTMTQTVQ